MPIQVTVRNVQAGGPAWEAVLPDPVATIGRSATCDLVLQEPEQHVSRLHATVTLRDGQYRMTVNSRINPIVVDDATYAPNASAALRDGTVILMPPFELSLRFASAAPALTQPAADAGGASDPFSWLNSVGSSTPAASQNADPFGLGHRAPTPPPAGPDIFQRARPAPDSGLVPGMQAAPANGFGGGPVLDPLLLVGGGSGAGGGLIDLNPHRNHGASSTLDHVHDVNLPFSFGSGIAAPAPVALSQSPAPPSGIDADLGWLDALSPRSEPAAEASAPQPRVATEAAAPAMPPTGVPGISSDAAIAAFLQGMNASGLKVPAGQEHAFFEQAGAIVQVAVQGLITLLLTRAEIKKELRAEDRTMLGAHANNPLKFMASSQEALRFLFDPCDTAAAGFLPPAQAVEDACSELLAHEMALVAGMRAAVQGAFRRCDPALIEKADKGGALVQLNRKSRLWDAYVDFYAKLQNDMADNLDRVFERDFLRAYMEQIQRMNAR